MSHKKIWLVTGAGRGLGTDIAKAALAAGHAVVATGRNPERVASALGAHDDLLVVALDVTDPAAAEAAAWEALTSHRCAFPPAQTRSPRSRTGPSCSSNRPTPIARCPATSRTTTPDSTVNHRRRPSRESMEYTGRLPGSPLSGRSPATTAVRPSRTTIRPSSSSTDIGPRTGPRNQDPRMWLRCRPPVIIPHMSRGPNQAQPGRSVADVFILPRLRSRSVKRDERSECC
jgi:short chain dehydrogenase